MSTEESFVLKDKRCAANPIGESGKEAIMTHNPTTAILRELNPLLEKFSDREIEDFISFLYESGFIWLDAEKIFYHDRLQFSIRTQGIDLFITNHDSIKQMLERNNAIRIKNPAEYDATMHDISINEFLIKIFVFLVFGNLFIGWLFFGIKVWIVLEILFVLLLWSFMRMQIFLHNKLDE